LFVRKFKGRADAVDAVARFKSKCRCRELEIGGSNPLAPTRIIKLVLENLGLSSRARIG
jgi:hypothetical protein